MGFETWRRWTTVHTATACKSSILVDSLCADWNVLTGSSEQHWDNGAAARARCCSAPCSSTTYTRSSNAQHDVRCRQIVVSNYGTRASAHILSSSVSAIPTRVSKTSQRRGSRSSGKTWRCPIWSWSQLTSTKYDLLFFLQCPLANMNFSRGKLDKRRRTSASRWTPGANTAVTGPGPPRSGGARARWRSDQLGPPPCCGCGYGPGRPCRNALSRWHGL